MKEPLVNLEIEKGARVRYSEEGKKVLTPEKSNREGEFLGYNLDGFLRVRWDGNKIACYYYTSFIEESKSK